MRPVHLLRIALLLGLAGCAGLDQSAGGSSYETENALTGRIVDSSGRGLSGVRIRVRRPGFVADAPFDSALNTRTDSLGTWSLRLPAGAWRLEARTRDRGLVLDIPDSARSGALRDTSLLPFGHLRGTASAFARIVSLGLQHQSYADSLGRFRIDSLPAGIHVLRDLSTGAQAFAQLDSRDDSLVGPLRPDTAGQILLDDFEDGNSRNRYGAWLGNGWWWISGASAVQLLPAGIVELPARSLVVDSSGNTSLHFSATFTGNSTSDWAETGVHLGSAPYDLSSLVSVRFRAKGSGALTVRLVIDGAVAGQSLESTVSLGGGWNDFAIPVAAFQLPSWSGSSVDSAGRVAKLRRCTGIAWAFIASGELWLDDVHLIGPSPSVLWGIRPPP